MVKMCPYINTDNRRKREKKLEVYVNELVPMYILICVYVSNPSFIDLTSEWEGERERNRHREKTKSQSSSIEQIVHDDDDGSGKE